MNDANPTAAPDARIAAQLAQAEALCARRGARLTELRRDVLALILAAPAPAGAYALLDSLRASRRAAAPPTIYRALDFLAEHGLIHKIERLSAYIGCIDAHDHKHGHAHQAQFLICRQCGKVTEIEDHPLTHALAAAAARSGFTVSGATIEAEGLCATCRSPQEGAPA
jgi:Fur family zinc uptake transcriptional regulator